jgi:hypothetical protein
MIAFLIMGVCSSDLRGPSAAVSATIPGIRILLIPRRPASIQEQPALEGNGESANATRKETDFELSAAVGGGAIGLRLIEGVEVAVCQMDCADREDASQNDG